MIECDKIEESAGKGLARAVLSGLDKFYSDPENRERFERWKKEREEGGRNADIAD